jgi:hypothetical protein
MIKSIKATATRNFVAHFVAPKENQVAKPFLTSKKDKKYHGLYDGYEVDAGNFIFALKFLQTT